MIEIKRKISLEKYKIEASGSKNLECGEKDIKVLWRNGSASDYESGG